MATTTNQRLMIVAVLGVVLLGVLGGRGLWVTHDDEPTPRPGALELVGSSGAPSTATPDDAAPFAATSRVAELRPGQMQTVQVTVTNPDKVAYRILELTATPKDAAPGCSGQTNLVVSSYEADRPGARSYVVPRRSSIRIPLTVMMLDTATSQDACRNASFPLALDGLATEGSGTS